MKPEIVQCCPPTHEVNNVRKTHSKDKGDAQDTQKHKRSSLRYVNVTTDDLMNGNFNNVLVQKNIGSGYGGSVFKCVVYPDFNNRQRHPGSGNAKSRESTSVVALKVLPKDRTKSKVAVNEVELLRAASDTNVVRVSHSI